MRARLHLAISLVVVLIMAFGHSIHARDLIGPGRRVLRTLEQALERLKPVERELGHGVPASLGQFVQHQGTYLPDSFFSPSVLRYATRHPELADSIADVATKFPARGLPELLQRVGQLPRGEQLVQHVLPKLTSDELVTLSRALEGKTVGSKSLDQVFTKARAGMKLAEEETGRRAPVDALFENVCKAQLEARRLTHKGIKLKEGTRILSGQIGRQGIDGIGVSPTGTPWIFEFTYGVKNLKEGGRFLAGKQAPQMSFSWVADCWKEFLLESGNIEQLRKMGIQEKFLNPNADFKNLTKEFHRRFLTLASGEINNYKLSGMSGDWWIKL